MSRTIFSFDQMRAKYLESEIRPRVVRTPFGKIVLTYHFQRRLVQRFEIWPEEAEEVIQRAFQDGSCSVEGDDVLVRYGHLLIECVREGRHTIIVKTVKNSSNAIPHKDQQRLENLVPINHSTLASASRAGAGAAACT